MIRRIACIALSTLMVVLGVAVPPLGAQQAAQDAATIQKLKAELEAAKRSTRDAELNLQKARADLAQLKAAEAELKNIVVRREQNIVKLESDIRVLRNDNVAKDVVARSQQERNQELLRRVQELSSKLAAMQVGEPINPKLAPNPNAPNPPNQQVKGKVSKIDPDNEQLVVISLGTDHGVKPGHTLEVFRTMPEPKYLGMVRIISVTTDSAAGRLIVPPGTMAQPQLRVGDDAWSKLMN